MDSVKIVVRNADGQIIMGYVNDFFPQKLSFHMYPYDSQGSQNAIEIFIKDLRAVYFVQDFAGDLKIQEEKKFPDVVKPYGRKVEVTFKDNEVMIGFTLGYDPQRLGFFLFPSNPHCNILRVFVVSEAVSKVRYI
jgi:hypothetical protein